MQRTEPGSGTARSRLCQAAGGVPSQKCCEALRRARRLADGSIVRAQARQCRARQLGNALQKIGAHAGLEALRIAARGTDNLLYPIKDALRADATLGEISDALREVFGVYTP